MTEKMIMVDGSATCGKTLYLKKKAEYLRKQGKKFLLLVKKRMVIQMTENKRYEKRMNFNVSLPDERCFKNEYCIVDEARDRYEALSIDEIIDRLNEQEETIQELKTRNKRQYERLKEVWDLIFDRNWEELKKKATEMEENEKRLQREYGG